MARLSRAEAKAHAEAEKLLAQDRLTDDEREFVLRNWQESANHVNSAAGAFFTPYDLALDAALFCPGRKVLDLCAGIGSLGLAKWWRSEKRAEVTCVEINPHYVEIGRKLFPEARWICGSVAELPRDLGEFDAVISNPPFGNRARIIGPRYSGEDELAVVDIAHDRAEFGLFILPSMSLPFEYSGRNYRERSGAKWDRFSAKVQGVEAFCESIDCNYYRDGWHGVSPQVECVSFEFTAPKPVRPADVAQFALFA